MAFHSVHFPESSANSKSHINKHLWKSRNFSSEGKLPLTLYQLIIHRIFFFIWPLFDFPSHTGTCLLVPSTLGLSHPTFSSYKSSHTHDVDVRYQFLTPAFSRELCFSERKKIWSLFQSVTNFPSSKNFLKSLIITTNYFCISIFVHSNNNLKKGYSVPLSLSATAIAISVWLPRETELLNGAFGVKC